MLMFGLFFVLDFAKLSVGNGFLRSLLDILFVDNQAKKDPLLYFLR